MTTEEKLALYRARYIDGMSMRAIAEKMHMTRQAISIFFRREKHSLPFENVKHGNRHTHLRTPMPEIEPDTAEKFLVLLANRDCSAENLAKIGISIEQAAAIYEYISSSKYQIPKSNNYPELSRWMRINGVSCTDMAERVGVSKNYMHDYLADKRLMRKENAERISEITGIPVSEFVVAPWGSGISEAENITKNKEKEK